MRLLPALITPEMTALREKTELATIVLRCYRACRHPSGALLRFVSVKLKWQHIDHRFNWDQTKTVHFLNFKKPHGYTNRLSRANTRLHFHLPFIASNPDCLLAEMEERKRVKRCFCRRPWMQKAYWKCTDSTFLFEHSRTRSSSLSPWLLCQYSLRSFRDIESRLLAVPCVIDLV